MTLDELIAAIERGEATNADVARALGGTPDEDGEFWVTPDDWPGPAEQRMPDWLDSLDAAAGLVPEGSWAVSRTDGGAARVINDLMGLRRKDYVGRAPTPAAALTIAALRARAAG